MEWLKEPIVTPMDYCSVQICWARDDSGDPCTINVCATKMCLINDGKP